MNYIKFFLIFNFIVLHAITTDRALRIYKKQYGNEKKVALVIGNSDYMDFAKLTNPVNDARAIRDKLKQKNFEVLYIENATQREMDKIVNRFAQRLKHSSIGLFYYAGHGIEVDGGNYLIPIDSKIYDIEDIKYEALPVDKIVDKMKNSKTRLNIIILDACRTNPFTRGSGGLAPINNAKGTLIAYATDAGATASDNPNEKHGLFTKYLLQAIDKPLNQRDLFYNVKVSVYHASDSTQLPYVSDKTIGDFYFTIDNNVNKVTKTTSIKQIKKKEQYTLINDIKYVLSHLNKAHYLGKDFDYGFSYGGIRIAYYYLISLLPYQKIEKKSPYPIFLKGPHKNGLNIYSNNFGYYNPKFVKWIYVQLKQVLSNKNFVNLTKPLFNKYLANKVGHYFDTYQLLKNTQINVKKFTSCIKHVKNDHSGFISYEMGKCYDIIPKNIMDKIEKIPYKYHNYYPYNGKLAAYWWIRRYADDTNVEFYKILKLLHDTYLIKGNK
jgi:hypothetical protein